MKRNNMLVWFFALSGLCLCNYVFAETITLNSGQTVEGKIIEETEKYIKLDYMGIPLTYWKEDIKDVDRENFKTKPVEIKIKSDNTQPIQNFLNNLDMLQKQIEGIVRSATSSLIDATVEKLENRDILQKAINDIENVITEIERLENPDYSCKELKNISLKTGNNAIRKFRGGSRSFSTIDERRNYWQVCAETMDSGHEEFNSKKKEILDKLNLKNK